MCAIINRVPPKPTSEEGRGLDDERLAVLVRDGDGLDLGGLRYWQADSGDGRGDFLFARDGILSDDEREELGPEHDPLWF